MASFPNGKAVHPDASPTATEVDIMTVSDDFTPTPTPPDNQLGMESYDRHVS